MAKIPSIEADVRIVAREGISITAGSLLKLKIAAAATAVDVKVLDAFSNRKSHIVEAGDSAFVVFLLVDHPRTSYDGVTSGKRFELVDADGVVGSGTVQARID